MAHIGQETNRYEKNKLQVRHNENTDILVAKPLAAKRKVTTVVSLHRKLFTSHRKLSSF